MEDTYYSDGCTNGFGSAYCIVGQHGYKHVELLKEKRISIEAEYIALLSTLHLANPKSLIYVDSMQLFREVNNCQTAKDLVRYHKCRVLMLEKNIKVAWIKRDYNLAGIVLEKRLSRLINDSHEVLTPLKKFRKRRW